MKREDIEKAFLESGINCDNRSANYVDDTLTNVIDVVDEIINAKVADERVESKKAALSQHISGSASDFEKELGDLINVYVKNGLHKNDLVAKVYWMLGNCIMS